MTVQIYSTASAHVDYSDVVCISAQDSGTVMMLQQDSNKQVSQVTVTKPHHVVVNY